MATFSELQARVARNIIDTPAAVSAAIPTLINGALTKLQRKHNFRVMEATLSVTTDINASPSHLLAALPARWKEWRAEPFDVPYSGRSKPLNVLQTAEDAALLYADEDEGRPRHLLIVEPSDEEGTAAIHLYPAPDGLSLYDDGEYRIVVPYWRYVTPLVASGATNWFTDNADTWLEYMATSDGFFLDHDEDRALAWATRAQGEMKEIVDADKRSRRAGQPTLIPSVNAR